MYMVRDAGKVDRPPHYQSDSDNRVLITRSLKVPPDQILHGRELNILSECAGRRQLTELITITDSNII